ncbi:hypothetical protein BD560DRAFT_333815 [Blakeslea trispora]|nr:hypothetical protein BD560DRAFT_333815 [Blakeslea trispora]
MSTKQILNLINKQPLDFLDSYHTDLIDEFTALLNETKSVCHRLDKCRKTVQFAHTKETISMDLMHIINFVYERYYLHSAHSNSFITLMGLLMIIVQVLNTEDEVQRQLLDESHIGRMAVLFMSRVLSNTKIVSHHDLPTCIQNQLFQIVLDYQFHQEDMNTIWFSALKSVCLQLARRDPTWEQKEEYTKVYSEATCLLTE